MGANFIVGVAGGSGAGKSEFVKMSLKNFDEKKVRHITQDNYYKSSEDQNVDAAGFIHFDLQGAIDDLKIAEHIARLKTTRLFTTKNMRFPARKVPQRSLCLLQNRFGRRNI